MSDATPVNAMPDRPAPVPRTGRIGRFELDLVSGQGCWDHGMYGLFGMAPAHAAPSFDAVLGFVHEEDRPRVAAYQAALRYSREVHADLRFRIRHADGPVRHVQAVGDLVHDDQGRAVRVRGVLIDETDTVVETHVAHERSAAANERLAVITDAAGIGMFSRDVDTGALDWSAANRVLYGLGPDDALPSWSDYLTRFVHPDDRERFLAEVARADAEGRPVRHLEYRVRTADGRERWIYSWTAREVRDGRRVAYGINVDVTDRHQAESERRERERIEQASRAQSAFLARVSHELRTPMNAVLGFAELLAGDRDHPLDGVQAERVERIRSAGRHLLSLIDDVLDLAAIDADRREPQSVPASLKSVVAQVLPWVATLAQQHGVEVTALPSLRGTVQGDPRWLVQVTSNLLTNAIKYNRRGGWVRVETRRRMRSGRAQWALVVRDGGRGLTEQQRQRLFEPFERFGAERDGIDGSGIGLSIVRRLVERMRGEIEVLSEPGSGTEFRIWLPSAPGAGNSLAGVPVPDEEQAAPARVAPAAPPSVATAAAATAPVLQVLCIEDNEVNLALVVELLALRPQVRLRTAVDGGSGLALARAESPDVVLLDIHLPDLDGREVLRRMRAEPSLAGCTVIGLSANAMPEDIRSALEDGFDDYWTKPIDFKRFLAGIDDLVARLARPAATVRA